MLVSGDQKERENGSPLDWLPKSSQYIVLVTASCYILGFLVTSVHLGSIGAANFDVIRTKYILSGAIFLVFLASFCLPIAGLPKFLRTNRSTNGFLFLFDLLIYTLNRYVMTIWFVIALSSLAGTGDNELVVLPSSDPSVPIFEIFDAHDESIIKIFGAGLAILAVVIVVVKICEIVFKKNDPYGLNPSRIDRLKVALSRNSLKRSFERLSFFFAYLLAGIGLVLVSVLAVNLSLGQAGLPYTLERFLTNRWERFILSSFILYTLATCYLCLGYLSNRAIGRASSWASGEDEDYSYRFTRHLFLLSMVIALVLPVYAIGVYPYIPQHVGGGFPIPVLATSTDNKINEILLGAGNSVYLLDRTSRGSLLLVQSSSLDTVYVLEVESSKLQSVAYKRLKTR